jgi:hypothetical protein
VVVASEAVLHIRERTGRRGEVSDVRASVVVSNSPTSRHIGIDRDELDVRGFCARCVPASRAANVSLPAQPLRFASPP